MRALAPRLSILYPPPPPPDFSRFRRHWSTFVMGSVRTAPLPLIIASLLLLGLAGGLLAYPAYAQSNDPPAEPTGLSVSVASGVGVNLTWNDPADATITGYEILRRDRAVDRQGVFHTIESDTGSADTAYTDATVAAGGEYVYRVKAINPHGRSVWSSYARADVPDNYEPPQPEHSPADLAPTNLTAALVDDGGVSLNLGLPRRRRPAPSPATRYCAPWAEGNSVSWWRTPTARPLPTPTPRPRKRDQPMPIR